MRKTHFSCSEKAKIVFENCNLVFFIMIAMSQCHDLSWSMLVSFREMPFGDIWGLNHILIFPISSFKNQKKNMLPTAHFEPLVTIFPNGEYFGQKSLFLPHPPKCCQRYFLPVFAAFFARWRLSNMCKGKNKEEMARSAEIFTFLCLKLHEMARN